MQSPLDYIDIIALTYLLLLWTVYARYAKYRAQKGQLSSLSRSLHSHRGAWARRLLDREMRMTDASLMASQERVVGFFASTTLLLMAAVLTALTTSAEIAELTSHIPFAEPQTAREVEAKLALILLILIYAFFKVTWSLRQYGFAAVVMGAAPDSTEQLTPQQREAFSCNLASLMDSAGHDNNSGLRAYYFCLSLLCWLWGTVAFLVATTITVYVLYDREFRSKTVKNIQRAHVD